MAHALDQQNESYRKQQELIRSGTATAQVGDSDSELVTEDDDTALLARNPFLSALTGPARATATTLEEEEGLTSQYTITVIDETGAQTEVRGARVGVLRGLARGELILWFNRHWVSRKRSVNVRRPSSASLRVRWRSSPQRYVSS